MIRFGGDEMTSDKYEHTASVIVWAAMMALVTKTFDEWVELVGESLEAETSWIDDNDHVGRFVGAAHKAIVASGFKRFEPDNLKAIRFIGDLTLAIALALRDTFGPKAVTIH